MYKDAASSYEVYAWSVDTYDSARPPPRNVQCETNDNIVLLLTRFTHPRIPLHSSRLILVFRQVIAEQSSLLLFFQLIISPFPETQSRRRT